MDKGNDGPEGAVMMQPDQRRQRPPLTQRTHSAVGALVAAPYAAALLGAAVLLFVVGVVLIGTYKQSLPKDAPLPAEEFSLAPDQVADPVTAIGGVDRERDQLLIPSLHVDAPLGVTGVSGGLLGLPADVDDTVLWNGSAPIDAPDGILLVAGHLDNADQDHGALYDLSTLQPGAAVYLVQRHVVTAWKVTGLSAAPKTALPTEIWAGPGGPRRLYIVTCGGPIVDGHYRDNVVVTAVPIDPTSTSGA